MPDSNESQAPDNHSDAEQLTEFDRLIHEVSRLRIMATLNRVGKADFRFLETSTQLQKSNLSMQIAKLEQAGYIKIHKSIKRKNAETDYSITSEGRKALARHLRKLIAMEKEAEENAAKLQEAQENAPFYRASSQTSPGLP